MGIEADLEGVCGAEARRACHRLMLTGEILFVSNNRQGP
jgi:hypothetical protein